MVTLDELKATLDTFSPAKVEFVARVMESLANPPSADIRARGTWLTGEPDWIEHFGFALSVHHGATTEPLGLSSFETVFRNACEHVQWSVDPYGSMTQRFVDLSVRPGSGRRRRLSLKSTAAKKMSKTALHISKLTEAAWIQDARTAKSQQEHTLKLFRLYKRAVGQIIMLRAFRDGIDEVPSQYQLVEIPVRIFDSIQNTPQSVIERDAPLIECHAGGQIAAFVTIDRSDAKSHSEAGTACRMNSACGME